MKTTDFTDRELVKVGRLEKPLTKMTDAEFRSDAIVRSHLIFGTDFAMELNPRFSSMASTPNRSKISTGKTTST